jgi:hypothetical protein
MAAKRMLSGDHAPAGASGGEPARRSRSSFAPAIGWGRRLWRWLTGQGYHPERHYMRGGSRTVRQPPGLAQAKPC